MKDIIMFLLGVAVIFLIALSVAIYDNINKLKYIKKKIIEDYGKEIDLKEVNIKMNSVSSYFRNKNEKNIIDDITWNDLNMDDIFKKINNTQSTAGLEILYNMLRNPLYNQQDLDKRNNVIEYFRKNEAKRKEVQYILGKLGISDDLYTTNCLYNEIDISGNKLLKYRLLAIAPIISLCLIFISGYFIILFALSIIFNIYISQNNKKYHYNTEGFTYVVSVVKAANKIKSLKIDEIEKNLYNIDSDLEEVKNIRKKYIKQDANSAIADVNVFSEYTKMIFLTDLITYEKVKNTIVRKSKNLKLVYEFVGIIDALIGVASFRDSLKYYSLPQLIKSNKKEDNLLEFTEIYHPLILNPVTNSGSFYNSILLTGSNASGKSTFIKAVAINAILAQTIYTCCAKDYKSLYFNVCTSMALKDDIFSNESYYIVEIKSLKRIIDNINDNTPCLCFVDEILRGTNTVERVASSCEVLKYLGDRNCICFAATHDIELTHLLNENFENYHFEEIITDKDIKFDYKLYKGRAQTRNAIKLLEFMKYDDSIVLNADKRAKLFLETGKWA
ncbi:MutS-related protein [Romboutsia lituseburensis]|uniref:MutS-related protein n=1 Tax=Romboutsia lituseburensis TaxID=1537 RepID=UPI00215AC64F|nr:DNA mismatch repair protein MutS [Romboutsia lituseburensis]MCR8746317.1 DNA mismatch repair protein MutS [Romboutsia lituseburensis]